MRPHLKITLRAGTKASVESLISVYVEVAVLVEELRRNSCTALLPEQHREKERSYQWPPAYQYHPRHSCKLSFCCE